MTDCQEMPFRRNDIISASPGVAEDLSDDQVALLDRLASGTEAYEIQVYGADPFHFGYYDKSDSDVNVDALVIMSKAGMVPMHAGVRKLSDGDSDRVTEHGWVEAKPRSYYEENDWFGK